MEISKKGSGIYAWVVNTILKTKKMSCELSVQIPIIKCKNVVTTDDQLYSKDMRKRYCSETKVSVERRRKSIR